MKLTTARATFGLTAALAALLAACGNSSVVNDLESGRGGSVGTTTGAASATGTTGGHASTTSGSGASAGGRSSGTATGGGLPPLTLSAGCNPLLDNYDCFLPYPSDVFRVADAGSPTGYWIETTGAAKLALANGTSADVDDVRPIDGYSHIPVILTAFPEQVSPVNFPSLLGDPMASVASTSPMLLINSVTGALVPCWVDFDPRATDLTRQAIVLHPLMVLDYQTRYIVAMHGLVAAAGGAVTVPEGFRRLRDSQTAGDPILGPLQSRYDQDIFPTIATAGVPRTELQLAWDFTTGDEGQADADMLKVRELTLAWLASNTPTVAMTTDTQNAAVNSWRQIQGLVLNGPNFTSSAFPGAPLTRDSTGQVAQNGTAAFTFTANVPTSVRDQFGPGRIISYGHGFFATQAEVTEAPALAIADSLRSVLICIDWLGMSSPDIVLVTTNLVSNPAQTLTALERVPQAMANFMVLQAALRGPLTEAPSLGSNDFLRPDSGVGFSVDGGASNAGQLVYDPTTDFYLGISQGAILGTTLNALSPDFGQVALDVGGAAFTQMMWRSQPFEVFLIELAIAFPDALDQQKYTATLQPEFDRVDPATYAPYVLQHPLAGSPTRQVAMQNGLGDPEVPNLGTFLLARTLGVPEMTPNDYPVYGLETQAAPVSSGLTLWDFGIDLSLVYGTAQPTSAPNDPVHDDLRLEPAVLSQLDGFFHPGAQIADTCDGGVCYAVEYPIPDGG